MKGPAEAGARPTAAADSEAFLDRADHRLLTVYDGRMAEAYARGGEWLVCRAGCTDCCIGPFAISAADARRLRQGVAALGDGPEARALAERARRAVEGLRPGFPGDPDSGRLLGGDDAETAFFDRHADLPCPALDPTSGRCQVYDHRPLNCRAYGPPLDLGGTALAPCELCFRGAPAETLEACRLDPDPEGLEDTLIDAVERHPEHRDGDTLVAFALLG